MPASSFRCAMPCSTRMRREECALRLRCRGGAGPAGGVPGAGVEGGPGAGCEEGRPACAGCGARFTDERWEAAEETDGGRPVDTHPTLCDTCKHVAVAAAPDQQEKAEPLPDWADGRTHGSLRGARGRGRCPSRSPAGGSHACAPDPAGPARPTGQQVPSWQGLLAPVL